MKRPTLLYGLLLAILAGLALTPSRWFFEIFFSHQVALHISLFAIFFGYVLMLLTQREQKLGSFLLVILNTFFVGILWFMPLALSAKVIFLALGISLNRIVLWHRSLRPMILDLFVAIFSLSVSKYLLWETGSFAMATWGFFLFQSLNCLIPSNTSKEKKTKTETDPFRKSMRSAESAIETLLHSS